MISHVTLKQFAFAGLLLQAFALKAEINTALWAGVEDAFAKIAVADSHFKAGKLVFMELQEDYSSLLLNFDVYKAKRQAAFSCIKSSIENLEGRLDVAIAYKAKVEYDAAVEQAAMRANIEAVRIEKNAIINGLIDAKEALQEEINGLEYDLATLAVMNAEKVDKALLDLTAASDSYRAMKAERAVFMTILDDVIERATGFEVTQTSDIAAMSVKCDE